MAAQLSWADRKRLEFINGRLMAPGFVNRSDLEREFGCSPATASRLLQLFLKTYPGIAEYDSTRKAYVPRAPKEGATNG